MAANLKFRYNWQLKCWQQWGFLRGPSVPIWKWFCVDCCWVKTCIDAKRAEILLEETVVEPVKEEAH